MQIENLLAGPRANYKLALDMIENFSPYFAMAEEYLWPSGKDNRRTPGRMSSVGPRAAQCGPGCQALAAWTL